MKTRFLIALYMATFFLSYTFSQTPQIPSIIRGPYIQNNTTSSAVVHWRTSTPAISSVKFSKKLGKKGEIITDNTLSTEHEVTIPSLKLNIFTKLPIRKEQN
jgi:hypothetical protein